VRRRPVLYLNIRMICLFRIIRNTSKNIFYVRIFDNILQKWDRYNQITYTRVEFMVLILILLNI
jgi:hypothetical protein